MNEPIFARPGTGGGVNEPIFADPAEPAGPAGPVDPIEPVELVELVAGPLGAERAAWLVAGLDLHPSLRAHDDGWVSRAVLAQALAIVLLDDLMGRVPSAAAYVEEKLARGEKVNLDHGAVRTVAGVPCGQLPSGQESVTRVLSALGYQHRETYDLDRLAMTGRSWCHADLPAHIPQYFVSELHAERFSPGFQAAAARVLASSRDPLDAAGHDRLADLRAEGGLGADAAAALLPALVACFARLHDEPALADYQLLLAESDEMAWIATEGVGCFNHATDRVADVAAAAAAERAAGRPIKDTVEVSGSGRIRQTAHRAPLMPRRFRHEGAIVTVLVPGSFFELISRDPLPDGSGIDLAFDAGNAQQIFAMTRGAPGTSE